MSQPCSCQEHPSGRAIRAVAIELNRLVESGRLTVEEVEEVFGLVDFVQNGIEDILAAGEGNDAIEDHFAGFACDITALRDGLLEHIPALVREKN